MPDNHDHPPAYHTIDPYDRLYGAIHDLPDVIKSNEANRTLATIIGSETFFVQTIRQREIGDTIFVQYIGAGVANGHFRFAIPPAIADIIARQRDQLTTKARRKAGKANAPRLRQMNAERQARGEPPAFLKHRGTRRRRRTRKAATN